MGMKRLENKFAERSSLSRRGLRGVTPLTPRSRGLAPSREVESKADSLRGIEYLVPEMPRAQTAAAPSKPPLSPRTALAPASPRLLSTAGGLGATSGGRYWPPDGGESSFPAVGCIASRTSAPSASATGNGSLSPRFKLQPPLPPPPPLPLPLPPPYVAIDTHNYTGGEQRHDDMRTMRAEKAAAQGALGLGQRHAKLRRGLPSKSTARGAKGAPVRDGQPSQRLDRPMMQRLLRETNMSRTELYRLFNRFKALCKLSGTPGSISKHMFKEGVSSLAFEDDAFVDRVFNLLDEDNNGAVEWSEFVNAVNALETGSPYDKLRFCFRVYDSDGSDSIDRDELHSMFSSMLLSSGAGKAVVAEASPALKELIEDFVDTIYDSFDADRNQALDFSEVLDALKRKGNEISDPWEIFGRTLVSRI